MSRRCYGAETPPGATMPPCVSVSNPGDADHAFGQRTITIYGASDREGRAGVAEKITLGPKEWAKFQDEVRPKI